MKQISGNCVLAFGLWGEEAPEHMITSVEIVDDNHIVTGDKTGQMIVWKVHEENDSTISPVWYLLGHSGSIVNITKSLTDDCNMCYVVSLSNQKEMGLWSCLDGRCVRLERHITLEHTMIKAYRPSSIKKTFLACCGNYQGIQLLDATTLSPLLSLQSCAHPDWVRSVCIFEHKHRGMHIVLGLSISGAITMWTIDSLEVFTNEILFETESKMLLLTCPISISICPSKPRLVMIIASNTVQIYDAASWSLLSEYGSVEYGFMSARFLDFETVLLRTKKGNCQLYHIPNNLDDFSKKTGEFTSLCYLDCDNTNVMCESVVVKDRCLRVTVGCNHGVMYFWKIKMEELSEGIIIKAAVKVSLKDLWRQLNMTSLMRPFQSQYTITSCHCEPSINSLMIGTSSGDILVMELLHSLTVSIFLNNTSKLPFTILKGHTLAVLALQYAKHIDEKAEDKISHWLWSGGEDFSIRLWNLETFVSISVFHCHSGPVTSFIVGPPLGLTKSKHDGRIITQKKVSEVELEVMKPINMNSWFGQRLYVSFDNDNGVAFLSLETKRVVLHLSLFSSINMIAWRRDHISVVLACSDGSVSIWNLGVGLLERKEEGQVGEDVVDSSTDHARLNCLPPLLPGLAHLKDRLEHSSPISIFLHPVHVNTRSISQILLCDIESLLIGIHCQNTSKCLLQAQLILSLLNNWGNDPCLDGTLESTIGLVRPLRHVCYGQVNVKTRTLSFLFQPSYNPAGESVSLLAGVSLCHAINNIPDHLLQFSWPRLSSTIEDKALKSPRSMDNRIEVRQVCCLFTTSMATTNLPRLLSHSPRKFNINEIPLVIQTFLQKYQNRCLEIREAAKTLLHAALDFLSNDERHELIQFWGYHGRVLSKPDTFDVIQEQLKYVDTIKVSKRLSSIYEAPNICDWRFWVSAVEQKKPSEIDILQTLTLTFFGIVGCRYGSTDPQLVPSSKVVSTSFIQTPQIDKTICGFGLDDHMLARTTCDFLMSLLINAPLIMTNDQKSGSHWSTMRCLAISLLGQGFPVWEPYLDISTLFTKLLEIVAPAKKILTGWSQGHLLSDEMDAVRSARSSLHAIALARPKVLATVFSREVLRLQTQTPSSGGSTVGPPSNGPAPGKVGIISPNQSQPPLLAARHEVIDVITVLCERKTKEIQEVFPEIMDILLACLSKLELRQCDLQQLFPPINLFQIVSSHTASGKVCVGTRSGQVCFYDVKVGKFNTSPGHGRAVTCVAFSPDGKQMASYSMPDNSMCIWQISSSGLFGMGSSHQVKLVSKLTVNPITISHTVPEEDHYELLWLEWTDNKYIHLVTHSGLINKIKL